MDGNDLYHLVEGKQAGLFRSKVIEFIFEILKLSITLIRKSLYTLLVIWYHTRHSLNTKIIKKLYLTLQKGCCLYPCDGISSVT